MLEQPSNGMGGKCTLRVVAAIFTHLLVLHRTVQ
jgi:hypothetical protein